MADTKHTDDNKSGRRASFARALHHVPNISRRVKQFENPARDDQTQSSATSRQKEGSKEAGRSTPKPTPTTSVTTREIGRIEEDDGGAEIPDIPLRRSSNTINSDFTASSMGTFDRILAAGALQNGSHPGPLSFHPLQQQAEQRYDSQQYHVPDEMALYPVTECSWESSLPDLSDVSESPTFRRETASSPLPAHRDAQTRDMQQREKPAMALFPGRRDVALSMEHSVDLQPPPIDLRSASPFDRARTPTRLVESRCTSITTGTSFQTYQTDTDGESLAALPALQETGVDNADALIPVAGDDLDPGSFDLVVPVAKVGVYRLEHRSELLFSVEHMRVIMSDPILLHRFSSFIGAYRPQSMPLLAYTLEALKAIRAMDYVNDIISRSLRPDGDQVHSHPADFAAKAVPELTVNESLRQKAAAAFEALARDDLPAYITHVWMDIAELSIRRKITEKMPETLQHASEGLAEVFCITDPSRKDNPIVFTSEEFHRTTGYGPDYVLGRNCRFLQGPKTNSNSVQRIRDMIARGKEHVETFLNYRRDGLPFMNLLMCVPLLDSKGQVRYFLGAQIDVSGLAKDCSGLESLRKLVDQDEAQQRLRMQHDAVMRRDSGMDLADLAQAALKPAAAAAAAAAAGSGSATPTPVPSAKNIPMRAPDNKTNDDFRLLAEMLSRTELETVRRFGGRMHRSQHEHIQQQFDTTGAPHKQRVVLHDQYELLPPPPFSNPAPPPAPGREVISDANGNINISVSTAAAPHLTAGLSSKPAFENYLVVRPFPSLKILFASPTLRVPGILQSHLMSRIGGSRRIHEDLEDAFAAGQSVTAKVKWISGAGALRHAANFGAGAGGAGDDSSSVGSGTVIGAAMGGGEASPASATIGLEGRPRWIHCTPLFGTNGDVGVWVVVIIDEEGDHQLQQAVAERKRPRRDKPRAMAPPVAPPLARDGAGGRYGGGGRAAAPAADEMSISEYIYRLPEDVGPRRREAWEWEAERGGGGGGGGEENSLRLRNEDSQRSEGRYGNKIAISTKPGGGGSVNGGGGGGGSANGDGGGRGGLTTTSPIDRAMGTISSARSMLLSKPSGGGEMLRVEKG